MMGREHEGPSAVAGRVLVNQARATKRGGGREAVRLTSRRARILARAGSRPRRRLTSTRGRAGDALAHGGEEGRSRLRKAAGRCEQSWIRGFPNGATHHIEGMVSLMGGQPAELKHLSRRRKGEQQ